LALALAFTLSAPDFTVILHSLDDVPVYHVSIKYTLWILCRIVLF
jgi:hypothetical protein